MPTLLTKRASSGCMAVVMTQPLDVLKTRLMNAKPGEYQGILHCALTTAKEGLTGFYKGTIPAAIRIIPHTILVMILYEQMRIRIGYLPPPKQDGK